MAGYTLAQAQAQLDAWMAASLAVSEKQTYTINVPGGVERTLTYVNADHIDRMIKFWRDEVNRLTAIAGGRRRTRYAVLG